MNLKIKWNTYTRAEWDALLGRCPHATLLQSYYYAQAMREAKQQGVRHGLIMIDGVEAGIVQMQEVKLFGYAIHAISIDRGPLWFSGFGKEKHIHAFAEELDAQFPNRLGRKRRFMPEYFGKIPFSFKNYIKKQKEKPYKTYLLDISPELDGIKSNLKKNWRNILNKSEKNDFFISIDENLSTFAHFLKHYTKDRIEKGYSGASNKFLASLAKYAAINNECLILNATEDDEIIASILIFTHGRAATYQAGWTTPYGRDKGAHHRLLWQAIIELKAKNITEFDLGGYNDDVEGIKKFKQGLGGHDIALIGSYN
jgi:hypothetical protein